MDTPSAEAGSGTLVHGGAGDDKVYGSAENDLRNGDAGNDALNGGDGTDTCRAGGGVNTRRLCAEPPAALVDGSGGRVAPLS